MTMNLRSDLPIKYYLNLYNEEGLSDEFTLLFEILQYIIRVANAKEKSLELKNIKFSSKSLKYVFGDKIKDETFKTNLVKSLKTMINDDYLTTEGDFIYFTKKGLTYFYLTND
jgi:hypothetical protein